SRRHAELRADGQGGYWITDLGSQEGTFTFPDGSRLPSNSRHPLSAGEWVKLGSTKLRVAVPDLSAEVECLPGYSASLLNAGVDLNPRVTVFNGTDRRLAGARVGFAVPPYLDTVEQPLPELSPGERGTVSLSCEGSWRELWELSEPRPVPFRVF